MASKHSISRRSFLKAVGAGSAAVAAAGVLTACGGSSSSTASSAASTAASAAPATTELAAEQVLNLIYTDLALIDVNDVRNSNEFEVLTAVQEGLFRTFTDENGVDVVENAGCESYDVSDDGLTYTFHLREGMVWSDDQPVTRPELCGQLAASGQPRPGFQLRVPGLRHRGRRRITARTAASWKMWLWSWWMT